MKEMTMSDETKFIEWEEQQVRKDYATKTGLSGLFCVTAHDVYDPKYMEPFIEHVRACQQTCEPAARIEGLNIADDIGDLCIFCHNSTALGSGQFVNRIPAFGLQEGYMCADCQRDEGSGECKCDECKESWLVCEYCLRPIFPGSDERTDKGGFIVCADCKEGSTAESTPR
jgi:hypothetical protein